MSSKIDINRLLARTRAAVDGLNETESEIAELETSPEPGDLYLFRATEDLEWAVIDRSPDGRFGRVVAADVDPLVGSGDVEVPVGGASGPLTLRCRFDNWCEVGDFDPVLRTGFLEKDVVEQVRRKLTKIEVGNLVATLLEEEIEGDPDYQDRMEELKVAQQRLALELTRDKIYPRTVDGTDDMETWPLLDVTSVAEIARGESPDPGEVAWWRHAHQRFSQPVMGLPAGTDPADFEQTGWAIVVHADESPEVLEALEPLLQHRSTQTGALSAKILEVEEGDDAREWLARYGVAAGDVETVKVPWYLLLIGSPAKISFEFQSMLAADYAVGRLDFRTPEDYRRYAESVIAQETSSGSQPAKKVAFWSPHPRDPASQWTADHLVRPLMDGVEGRPAVAGAAGFETVRSWGEEASKEALDEILHGDEAPSVLFAAAPGLSWPAGHPEQRSTQGALICSPDGIPGSFDNNDYFAASDVADRARLEGSIAFLHAAYSAGTSRWDDLLSESPETEPFVATLPQRLLAHPRGGALAVIGSVGRGWSLAPLLVSEAPRCEPFERALSEILAGAPVGHALRAFHERQAARVTNLAEVREKAAFGKKGDDEEVAGVWVERHEFGSLVLLGDPAVRLEVRHR